MTWDDTRRTRVSDLDLDPGTSLGSRCRVVDSVRDPVPLTTRTHPQTLPTPEKEGEPVE